jgi:hypothetical protein
MYSYLIPDMCHILGVELNRVTRVKLTKINDMSSSSAVGLVARETTEW